METKTAREIAKKHFSDKLVLVASRRTDMPCFHLKELIRGLNEGQFHPQPLMNKLFRLTFKPNDIHSIGLWSQDFGPWMDGRKEIKPHYNYWYRFSILPDDTVCKPVAPPLKEQLNQLSCLVDSSSPEQVFLFVDPLIKYRLTGQREWRYNYSAESIEEIVKAAAISGITSISFSIIDYYSKIKTRAYNLGVEFYFFNPEKPEDLREMKNMMGDIKLIAATYSISIRTCCEKLLHDNGIITPGAKVDGRKLTQFFGPGACVDGFKLIQLFGPGASLKADSGQRKKYGCRCTRAVDIGRYINSGEWSHACGHQCPQCYARPK